MMSRVREALDEWVDAELGDRFSRGEPLTIAPGVRRYCVQDTSGGNAGVTLTVFSRVALRARGLDQLTSHIFAVARTAPHPCVQPLLGVGVTERLRWCTDAIPRSRTLSEWIALHGPLSVAEVLDLGDEIAAAVDAVHARGIAHGGLELGGIRRDDAGALSLRPPGVDRLIAALAESRVEPAAPATDWAALARVLHALLLPRAAAASEDGVTSADADLLAFLQESAAAPAGAVAKGLRTLMVEARAVAARDRVMGRPQSVPTSPLDRGVVKTAVAADASSPDGTQTTGRAPVGAQPLLMVGPPLGSMRGPAVAALALLMGAAALSVLRPHEGQIRNWGWTTDQRTEPAAPAPPPPPPRPDAVAAAVAKPPSPVPSVPSAATPVAHRAPALAEPRPSAAPPMPAPVQVELPQLPARGHLSVSARPWAFVYVDDSLVGHTPLHNVGIASGQRRIRLARPGFRAHDTSIVVGVGDAVRLLDVVLEPEKP